MWDSINGGSTEFFLKGFTKNGLLICEDASYGNTIECSFYDVASILNQIGIVEQLESIIKENKESFIV